MLCVSELTSEKKKKITTTRENHKKNHSLGSFHSISFKDEGSVCVFVFKPSVNHVSDTSVFRLCQ